MAGQRLPIEIVQARGAKHLTKAEIKERQACEIKPIADDITAPEFLTAKQKKEFQKYADQLKKLKIMGETDVDALARFIVANDDYKHVVRQMRKPEVRNDPDLFGKWSRIQDIHYKQCRSSANDLGLTISSRCKLVIPENKLDVPKENKFKKFEVL